MGGLGEEQVDRNGELERVAKPGFEHPDFRLFPPGAEAVSQVGEPAAAPGPCPPSPRAQGTHMLKAADRSSLVTVILQELPPVETQDQRCRAKRTRGEGSTDAGSSRSSHSRNPGGPEDWEQPGPAPYLPQQWPPQEPGPGERKHRPLPAVQPGPTPYLPQQWPSGWDGEDLIQRLPDSQSRKLSEGNV